MKNLLFCLSFASCFLVSELAIVEAAVVSFRDDFPSPFGNGVYAGTEDTMLVRNNTGAGSRHNFGARPFMQVGHLPVGNGFFDRYGLIRFDVTSLAGRFRSIDSVTLRLFVSNEDAGLNGRDVSGSGVLAVYQFADANQAWEEGTGAFFDSSSPVTPGMTTWDQRIEGVADWAGSPGARTPGVDYLTPLLASRGFDQADEAVLEGGSFDLTLNDPSLIADWAVGNNAGLYLGTLNARANNSITFFTNNASSPIHYPELIVEFAPIPEPSAALLVLSLMCASGAVVKR